MSKIMLVYEDNWADEMDVAGFILLESDIWKSTKIKIENLKDIEIGVGSNEDIEYATGLELLEQIQEIELTDNEVKMYKTHFKNTYDDQFDVYFGQTGVFDQIFEYCSEDY